MSFNDLVLIMFLISIGSGIIVGLIALAITREVEKAELLGVGGAIIGASVGFLVAYGMLINSSDVVPDQVTEQTIAVEDLKEMTTEEMQELIEDDPVTEEKKDSVTIDELKSMTMEEIQELIAE